uniref:Uncharacterized protein n=1 Tax=Bos indicus x Bos taurus TaxID=30522 RepID=A0A4W2G7Q5_BOBOX
MVHSLRPHGLSPTRLLFPWDSSGKDTGGKEKRKNHECGNMSGAGKHQNTHGCVILPGECKSQKKHCCRL